MVDSTARLRPTDQDWFIPESESFRMRCATAVATNKFVFAVQFEGDIYDPSEWSSRIYMCQDGVWMARDVPTKFAGMVAYGKAGWKHPGFAALTNDANVWFVGDDFQETAIQDAAQDGHSFRVTMLGLRAYEDELFAFGMDGLLFRYTNGNWIRSDSGMFKTEAKFSRPRPVDAGAIISLRDIAKTSSGELYACGFAAITRPALFYQSHDAKWLGLNVNEHIPSLDFATLESILVDDENSIWVATTAGVLLRGNYRDGFKVVTEVARKAIEGVIPKFRSLVRYRGNVIAGGENGTFMLNEDGSWRELLSATPVKSVYYKSEREQAYIDGRILQVVDSVLFAFGYRTISHFDGASWTHIEIPPVYRNGR